MKMLRTFTQDSFQQIKSLTSILLPSYLIIFGLLLSIALIGEYFQIPVSKFTRDPIHVLNGHPFTGVLSNIGILFWCSTAAICFFGSAILWMNKSTNNSKFLLFSGMITLLLLLDDLFMLHEIMIPKYLHIPEAGVYAGYLIIVLIYLVKFREEILKAEYTLLNFALGFFALSLVTDFFSDDKELKYLIEDGFKLLGIVTWFLFFVRTCFILTQESLRNKS